MGRRHHHRLSTRPPAHRRRSPLPRRPPPASVPPRPRPTHQPPPPLTVQTRPTRRGGTEPQRSATCERRRLAFELLGSLTVGSALLVAVSDNLVHCALWLVGIAGCSGDVAVPVGETHLRRRPRTTGQPARHCPGLG